MGLLKNLFSASKTLSNFVSSNKGLTAATTKLLTAEKVAGDVAKAGAVAGLAGPVGTAVGGLLQKTSLPSLTDRLSGSKAMSLLKQQAKTIAQRVTNTSQAQSVPSQTNSVNGGGGLLGGLFGGASGSAGVSFGKDQSKSLIPIVIAVAVAIALLLFGGKFKIGR
tara:strand:+ start:3745 stop:4239 length:495 start_codon:yes stop_codon:yes gene_type:complete